MVEKNYMAYKVNLPEVKHKILKRNNIGKFIEDASLDEIIYLIAPFGSGKTMAILSWLHENNKKAAWITLDENEDSPLSFWTYLTTAVLIFAGENEKAENIANDKCFRKNPRAYLRETLIRVSPKINERILVIDNLFFVQNEGILHEIKEIISNMLGCWKIIIISRTELPPLFNDFVLKKHLCLLTLEKLKFNLEETEEYFIMNGFDLTKPELLQLYNETDGWSAALNAILTVTHNGTIKFNDTAKAYVMNYFNTKIWETLDELYKTFLLKTSILDKLTPSICHYVAGIEDAALVLRNLFVKGIFISKLDGRDSYCYHRVFREFLIDKLNNSSINVNRLYINAGWWLYEKNESIPALLCFYRAKYLNGINMAFKKVKPIFMGIEEYIETTYCLTSLNIMDLKAHPEVAVRIALLHFLTDNITEMQRIHKIVEEWLKPGVLSIPPEEYVDFYWEVGWLRYVNPDIDILLDPEFEKWVNTGEYAPHLVMNDRARASTLWLPSFLGGFRDYSLNVEKMIEFYKRNNETQKSFRDVDSMLVAEIIFAEICYEREDFEQAEKIIKKIMPIIEREKYISLYFSCIVLLVKITRATHNFDEINGLIECLRTQINNNGYFFLLPNFHAFELRNRLIEGISGITEQFEKENIGCKEKPHYYMIYRYITLVRVLISEKKFNEASLMLGNLEYLLRPYKRNMDLIELNILRAIAEYGLKHKTEALHYLKIAFDNGRKSGLIRIFSDESLLLFPILNLVYKKDSDEYINRIKASCKLTLKHSEVMQHLNKNEYEPLTTKEIEILKLLQTAMTYKEIAIHKNIKYGTVKGHIHNIYSKLSVKNRTSAILVASKIGII